MPRGNKFGAVKKTVDGIKFASGREADRYLELKLLLSAGEISDLKLQPKFQLQDGFTDQWSGKRERAITYTADFRYVENGHQVVEDVKGVQTAAFRLKWKLTKVQNPDIEFRIVK